jgi:hypothetical protein
VTGSPAAGDPGDTVALTKCFAAIVAIMSKLPGSVVFTPDDDIVGGGYTIAETGRTASAAIITRTTIPCDTDFFIGIFLTVITISVLVFR